MVEPENLRRWMVKSLLKELNRSLWAFTSISKVVYSSRNVACDFCSIRNQIMCLPSRRWRLLPLLLLFGYLWINFHHHIDGPTSNNSMWLLGTFLPSVDWISLALFEDELAGWMFLCRSRLKFFAEKWKIEHSDELTESECLGKTQLSGKHINGQSDRNRRHLQCTHENKFICVFYRALHSHITDPIHSIRPVIFDRLHNLCVLGQTVKQT